MPDSEILLVVNADGFGSSAARNHAVQLAHRQGIVTSTSILGNATEVDTIKADLGSTPGLGIGVQLTLVGGGPVAKSATVPSLLDAAGAFPTRPRDLLLVWAKAALRADELEQEFDAQVARWRDVGLAIDYLCTKDDLGVLPMVGLAVEKVARRHGIACMRTAVEKPTLTWTSDLSRGLQTAALGAMAWYSRRQLGARRHGPQTWGHFEAGRLDEIRVLEIIGRLGPGSHELVCQPDLDPSAHSVPARSELQALTSTRVHEALGRRGIKLCRWSELV
jgi:chitin disaccharide deacetylase